MAVPADRNLAAHRAQPRVSRPRVIGGARRAFVAASRSRHPVLTLVRWMVRGYQVANAGDLAAALAFNALMALIPVLLLLASLGGLALQHEALMVQLRRAIIWILPAADARAALEALLNARRHSGWLGVVSLLGFAWIGANFVNCLSRCMNRIYGAPDRHFVHERVRGFLLVLVFAVLFLLVSLAATLPTLFVRSDLAVIFEAWLLASTRVQTMSYAASFAAALVLFLVIYRLMPTAGQRLRDVWPGSVVAALLLVALLQVFPLYLRWIGGANRYGQFFGFVPLVVGWFALLAHVLLFGTYVNASYRRWSEGGGRWSEVGRPKGRVPSPLSRTGRG